MGIHPFAPPGDGDEHEGLNKEVDTHEDPNDVQGEIGKGVVECDSDDPEKDKAGKGADHDGLGGSGSTKGGFHDDGGGESGLENTADEDEGDGNGDELGGLGIGFGQDEVDDDFGRNEKKHADRTHEGEGVKPGGAEGFHRHGGIVCSEVLADEGGGGGPNRESGKKAQGLDANGDEVGPQCSVESEARDESEDVGVDEPHPEHFNALGKSDASNAGHHFALGSPIGFPKREGDFVGVRSGGSVEEGDDDDGSEDPGEKTSIGQSRDAHSADGGLKEDEA